MRYPRGFPQVETSRDVVVHAVRQVWRSRRVALFVIATVGPATALAAVLIAAVGSVMSAALPMVDNDRVTQAFQTFRGVRYPWSYPQILDVIEKSRAAHYAGITYFPKTILTQGGPRFVWIEAVTTNYPDVMGIRPVSGRWFTAEENLAPLRDFVVVLGEDLCRQSFATSSDCVGRTVQIGNATLTVIGVMPGNFKGTQGTTDAWTPLMLAPLGIGRPGAPFPFWTSATARWMALVGRLESAGDLASAQVEMRGLYRAFAVKAKWLTASSTENVLPTPELLTLREALTDPLTARAGRILQAGVALLLLMTCANAALLVFAHIYARAKQFAIQLALGATLHRIVAGIIVEAFLTALTSAIAGAGLSLLAVSALARLANHAEMLKIGGLTLSFDALGGGVLVAMVPVGLTAVFLLPMAVAGVCWALRREWVLGDIHIADRVTGSLRVRGWQSLIVACQTSCAVVLTIGTGLLGASYVNAVSTPLGFRVGDDVTSIRPSADPQGLSEADSISVTDRISEVAGVQVVARVSCLPLSRACFGAGLTIPETGDTRGAISASAVLNRVDVDALALLGTAIRGGRSFTDDDNSSAPRVVVLSRNAASRLRLDRGAVGQRIAVAGFGEAEVIGIVDDVKYDGLTEAAKPTVYVPWSQYQTETPEVLLVKTVGPSSSFSEALRSGLRAVRPEFEAAAITPLPQLFRDVAFERRLQLLMLGIFAGIGIAILITGVVGVTGFVMRLGVREIGIRQALGATPMSVLGLIAKRMGTVVVFGATVGVTLSIVTRGWWKPLLYQIDPLDPLMLASGASVTCISAAVSVYRVARHAVLVDLAEILRAES